MSRDCYDDGETRRRPAQEINKTAVVRRRNESSGEESSGARDQTISSRACRERIAERSHAGARHRRPDGTGQTTARAMVPAAETTTRRRLWLWRDGVGAGVWTAVVVFAATALLAAATDDTDRVHVVSVRLQTDGPATACTAKCTGLMISQRAVLTAASCAGSVDAQTAAAAAAAKTTPPKPSKDARRAVAAQPLADDADDEDPTVATEVTEATEAGAMATTPGRTTARNAAAVGRVSKTIVKIESPPNAITVTACAASPAPPRPFYRLPRDAAGALWVTRGRGGCFSRGARVD